MENYLYYQGMFVNDSIIKIKQKFICIKICSKTIKERPLVIIGKL